MSLKSISPIEAKALMENGAILVDVRETHERERSHIPGSVSLPLSQAGRGASVGEGASNVVFYCKSGMRTRTYAKALANCTDCEGYVVEGGIDGWARAGLPVTGSAASGWPDLAKLAAKLPWNRGR